MSDEKPPAQQAIKEANLKSIFLELHRRKEMTRVQLAHSTGLSAATVSALVDELVRRGLFFETGPAKTDHIGRKPINLRINPESRQLPVFALNRWGVQLVVYDLNLRPMETLFIPHASDQYGGFKGEDPESDGNPDTGVQYNKMESAGISCNYFDKIILSDKVGVNKPHPDIFLHSLNEIGAISDRTIMIGDNVLTDIKGAYDCHIDQIWYNPNSKSFDEFKPTYVVDKLSGIMDIL